MLKNDDFALVISAIATCGDDIRFSKVDDLEFGERRNTVQRVFHGAIEKMRKQIFNEETPT